jgi:ankyrin repeat protein/energy-coupling factor transporter ATP-binding protein EcfA2
VGEESAVVTHEQSGEKGDGGPLLSLTSRDSLSHEVFSNLPEDLQEILRTSTFTAKPVKVNVEQALLDAVTCGDATTLETLLKAHGLPKNTTNSSLIHVAAARGFQDCLQVILEAGGDPNAVGPANATPVILSAAEGHHKCVRILIGAGANVSHRDAEGCDALHRALLGSHKKCVQILLDCGIESLVPNNVGHTLLHAAVQSQSVSCIRLILTHLRAYHSESIVSQLLNAQDSNGQSILHHAAGGSAKDCLEVLLPSPELDVDLRDRWNRTAIDVATTDCRDLLINREYKEVVLCVASFQKSFNQMQETQFAVGRVRLLKHHKWSDFDLLLSDSLASYCKLLKGHSRSKRKGGSLFVQTPELDKKSKGKKQPHEVADEFYSGVGGLILSSKPIASYHVGQLSWKPGESPKGSQVKTPYMLFPSKERDGESAPPEVVITLKGKHNGSLNDAAFSSLYSVTVLEGYLNLINTHKNVVIHGPTGSGKSHLARLLAESLKVQLDSSNVDITHASMHPGFQRDDFYRLLHYTGSLVPFGVGTSGEPSQDTTDVPTSPDSVSSHATSMSSGMLGPHIIILDDLDRISIPEVIRELLGSIDKRGPQYATWLGPTLSRGGSDETHPPGSYYLREDVYIIATMNKNKSGMLDQSVHGLFKHIWLTPEQEPLSGLLLRHIHKKVISVNRGTLPPKTSTLYLTARWVCDVWCLINHYLAKMGLLEAMVGPRHFFSCPIKSGSTDAMALWLAELWNSQVAPLIRDVTVYLSPSSGKERTDICSQVLTTLTQRAFAPTSPLDHQELLKFILSLDGGEQGLASIAEASLRKKNKSEGRLPGDSCLDLKEENSPYAIQRTFSAGSLPHHSVGSTPSSTPQSTPGLSRRSTLLGNTQDFPKQLQHSSFSTSILEGVPSARTKSLPHNTPPISKREWKIADKKKKKGIGRVFRKKNKFEDEVDSSSSSLASTEDRPKQGQSPREIDALIDMMYQMGDRLEEQRSPLPAHRYSHPSAISPLNGGAVVSPLARDSSTTPTPGHHDLSQLLPVGPRSASNMSTADSSGTSVCSAREGETPDTLNYIVNGTGRDSPRHHGHINIPSVKITSEK